MVFKGKKKEIASSRFSAIRKGTEAPPLDELAVEFGLAAAQEPS